MTKPIHRHNDSRACGATTLVTGQKTVYANGELVSVDQDPNTHDAGNLIAACNEVYVKSKKVVIVGNSASADSEKHSNPASSSGSPDVNVGE
jgi:uncharacterized Zn-binding protein involved in type VI secretion